MEDCIFCKIAKGETKSYKVYEDENAFAFLDINPMSPGHTVVIPKKHAHAINDLNDEEVSGVFIAVKNIVNRIKNSMRPDGFNVGWNHDKAGGQVVPHLHIHVIPRYEGDGGGSIHSIVRNPPKESLDAIMEKIKAPSETKKEKEELKMKPEWPDFY